MQTHKASNNVNENNVSIVGNGVGPKISNLQHETCLPSTSNDDIGSVPRMSNLQHASSSTSSSDIIPALENSGNWFTWLHGLYNTVRIIYFTVIAWWFVWVFTQSQHTVIGDFHCTVCVGFMLGSKLHVYHYIPLVHSCAHITIYTF